MDVAMKMPDLATTGSPMKVIRWLVDPGQSVRRGDPLLEVETDKAVLQVESVLSGRLSSVSAREGDEVEAGETIAIFETDQALPVRVQETSPAPSGTDPGLLPSLGRQPTGAGGRTSFFARNRQARSRGGKSPAKPDAGDRQRTIDLTVPQRVAARRMVQSKQSIPHFYLQTSASAEAMVARRQASG